ncbi:MAG TPA: hypothetical protein VI934_02905 [Candidatus Nanoarchaeia archaeon]|nr:hypothetical protein [Candidatus Nanoarchaeia archaeon]
MGSIISSRLKEDGKVIFEVLIDADEALQLRGNMSNVHIFSDAVIDIEANLAQRGKNEATKYFLVPKQVRRDMKISGKVRCQKFEARGKTFFIYVIEQY